MKIVRDQALVQTPGLLAFTSMFSNPAATLARLRERPQWFLPLLVAGVYSVVVNLYVIERVGLPRLIRATLEANAAFDPQAVLETAMSHSGRILLFQGVSTAAGTFVAALVVTQVLWLTLAMIGRELGFRSVLSVVSHATMLLAVIKESMLALTVTLMRNMDGFDLRCPLATNPAFFVRPSSPVTFRLLAALDLIVLAQIVTIAFGLSKLSDRLTFRNAVLLVVIPWVLYSGISILLPL